MEDVYNGSYLRSGGIWQELNRRKTFARFAAIKDLLSKHTTQTLYEDCRTNLLQLISRKLSYKEHLIKRQDDEFSESLNKSINNVETEINTLISFVMSFDRMAEFMRHETAGAVDEWYKTKLENTILNELLNAQTERATEWSTTAFSLHDHILKSPKPLADV